MTKGIAKRVIYGSAAAVLLFAGWANSQENAAAGSERLKLAQQEGTVVWYAGLVEPTAELVADKFEEATGIKVDIVPLGGQETYTRVMQEAQLGAPLADVVLSANEGHFVAFRKADILAPYKSPHEDHIPDKFKNKDGYYIPYILRFGVAYNTDLVKEVPRSWAELVDPAWNERGVIAHPAAAVGAVLVPFFWNRKFGEDFFPKIAATKPRVFQSIADGLRAVETGERAVSLVTNESNALSFIEKGSPVGFVFPDDGIPAIAAGVAILKGSPHPNAAQEFLDYLLSKEGQQLLVDKYQTVVRDDVTFPKVTESLTSTLDKVDLADPVELESQIEAIRKRFTELFGV